jgi:hypothetical protein
MLHVGQHDVVAGPQIKGMRGNVEPFGGVFCEGNLGRLCARNCKLDRRIFSKYMASRLCSFFKLNR